MKLPVYVKTCIDALENAGYQAYAVGGCVRDHLLGLEPHDYDLCTNAAPEQTQAVFAGYDLVLAGLKHGTVGVIIDGDVVEITTYRTEGGYADARHPGWVAFVDRVEEDLARRDFTVNAMAWSPARGLADPFGGQADLKNRILRCVGDPEQRFREDALRILRGARFAARFRLKVEEKTAAAMEALAPLMEHLARERVFEELCKLITAANAADLLRFAPVLAQAIPELAPTMGFDQHNSHHAFDVYTHIVHVVEGVPNSLALRWAALLHDVGKVPTFTLDEGGKGHFYGHAQESARMADAILRRLKAPTALRERVVFLIDQHMTVLTPERKLLRRRISRWGMEATRQLLALQRADFGGKGVAKGHADFDAIAEMLDQLEAEDACLGLKDLAVNGRDLMALGLEGKAIGTCLDKLLELVLDEQLPNERQTLLAQAKVFCDDHFGELFL